MMHKNIVIDFVENETKICELRRDRRNTNVVRGFVWFCGRRRVTYINESAVL